MVSAAVDLARGAVTKEDIEKSLTKSCKMKVNVAPAQGLFLDRSFFEIYNQQLEKKGHNNDHKPLKWVEGDEIPPAGKKTVQLRVDQRITPGTNSSVNMFSQTH
jgi:SPX domain protein involved in polyphosphate accumulation